MHARIGPTVAVLGSVLALLVFAHSRWREDAADDRAVEVTGDPVALARAHAAIQRASNPDWRPRSTLSSHGNEEGLGTHLLSTHPPVDDRIERLLGRVAPRR